MAFRVRGCPFCGSCEITVWSVARVAAVTCLACEGAVRVEFEPPDRPGLRARVDPLCQPRPSRAGRRRPVSVLSALVRRDR